MPADIPDWSTVSTVPLLVTPGDPQPYTALAVQAYSFAFPVPKGAQAVRFLIGYGVGIAISNFAITGNVSSPAFTYQTLPAQSFASGAQGDSNFRVHPVDTVITLAFNITAQAGNAINILAEASIVLGDLPVEIVGTQGISTTLPLTVQAIQATPWEFCNNSVDVGVALANGGTATAIAAVAGQRIYMGGISVGFDATSPGNDLNLRDGVGGPSKGRVSASTLNPPSQDWKGRPLSVGNALEFFANGGAMTFRGVVPYSQAA